MFLSTAVFHLNHSFFCKISEKVVSHIYMFASPMHHCIFRQFDRGTNITWYNYALNMVTKLSLEVLVAYRRRSKWCMLNFLGRPDSSLRRPSSCPLTGLFSCNIYSKNVIAGRILLTCATQINLQLEPTSFSQCCWSILLRILLIWNWRRLHLQQWGGAIILYSDVPERTFRRS